jgi:hypothetical protein
MGMTAAAAPAEPKRPALALIGAVVGDTIALFVDRSSLAQAGDVSTGEAPKLPSF